MIPAILATIGSLASILGLAFQLRASKQKPVVYLLLLATLGFSVWSTFLWSTNQSLVAENKALRSARHAAAELAASWPDPESFDYVGIGEFRGIVLSGLAFLEANRDQFPDTYAATRTLMLDELGVGEEGDYNDDEWDNRSIKRRKLQEAAEAMVHTIRSLRVQSD